MSEEKNNATPEELPALVKKAPELLPLWDWWVKEGRSTVVMLAVAAAVVGGFYGVRNWMQARDARANAALQNSLGVEDLEAAVADFGSTKVGPALKLRLAKAYYDAEGRAQDAFDLYDKLVKDSASDSALMPLAAAGRAHALEALGKFAEAREAFVALSSETNSPVVLDARLGAARCKALAGDKDGAVKDLDALKAATTDELAKSRIERMTDVVKRYDPARPKRSLFDAANAAAATIKESEKTPAAAPAKPAAAPAKPAAAPAKPAEAKK